MTRAGGDLPEPPSTYAHRDINAWLTSLVRGARVSKMEAFRNGDMGTLENLEISLEIDAQKTSVQPSPAFAQWLQELTGRPRFEPHFELPAAAELVLRALAQGHYHAVSKVVVDGETCWNNAGRPKDVRGTVELLTEASHRTTRCDQVQLVVADDELGESMAAVTVKRVPKRGEHAISVRFDGVVREQDFRRFLGYLTMNLNATFVVAP